MFIRSFIELLMLYKHITSNMDMFNNIANGTILNRNINSENLLKINNDIALCSYYKDFIEYYDDWYISY